MVDKMTLYDALGIGTDASLAEIRTAFVLRASAAHPDTGGSDAALQEATLAFETLSDSRQRARYDRELADCWCLHAKRMASTVPAAQGDNGMHGNHISRKSCHKQELQLASQWVGQPITSRQKSRDKVLAQLHKLLQELPRNRRHEVLSMHFSEAQRLALERWILGQGLARPAPAAGTYPAKASPNAFPLEHPSCYRLKDSPGNRYRRRARVQTVVRVRRTVSKSTQEAVSTTGGIARPPRIHRYYLASQVVVNGLRLFSRTDRSLEVALRFHIALVTIKQRASAEEGSSEEMVPFEDRFRAAVWTTLEDLRLDARAMGLKFIVGFKALWIASPLRTPAYTVPGGLEAGLQAWRRLADVRRNTSIEVDAIIAGGSSSKAHRSNVLKTSSPEDLQRSWEQLRHEYLCVMVEAGCCRDAVQRRLRNLEQEHFLRQEKQLQRWNQVRMAEEERLMRRKHAQEERSLRKPQLRAERSAAGNRCVCIGRAGRCSNRIGGGVARTAAAQRARSEGGITRILTILARTESEQVCELASVFGKRATPLGKHKRFLIERAFGEENTKRQRAKICLSR